MFRFAGALILAALALAAPLAPASAATEKRVALVLGNSSYRHAAPLANPRNDAADMSVALRRLGFTVIDGIDLDREGMEERIRRFATALTGADVGLFYYAGHGLQVNGDNYLAPVDASLKAESDLDFEAVPLNLVLKQLQRSARVGLVFLDACRDNPLAQLLGQSSRSLAIGRGLAAVERASGMLIAFATEPGSIALDGNGRNSPFTSALLKHIGKPDVSISDVMIDVRKEVMATTGNLQVPWENSSLTGRFSFNPGSVQVAAASQAATGAPVADARPPVAEVGDTTIEHTFWTSIQDSNDPKLFQAYLRRFPTGVYAPIAESKLGASRAIAVEAADVPASKPVQTAAVAAATTVTADAPAQPLQDVPLLLQAQLKRVGCYTGALDGIWGPGSRSALGRFNRHARADLPTTEATAVAFDVVSQHQGTICPVVGTAARNLAPEPRTVTRVKPAEPRIVHEPHFSQPRSSFSLHLSRRSGGGGRISIGIGGGGGFRF